MSEPSREPSPGDEEASSALEHASDSGVDAFAQTAEWSPGSRGRAPVLAEGTVLGGNYQLEGLIGRGGMGAVYKATHRTLRRAFAVKVVVASSEDDARAAYRLVQEARTASAIRHDHIIDVTDLGHTDEGLVFVVMELLEGEDLAQRIDRQARESLESGGSKWLPDDEAQEIFDHVLDGVAAAHAAGVVHRDLKPANVFLARRGDRVVTKILDFGMSKMAEGEGGGLRLTQTGQLVGTPLYMAPEQSRGAGLDHRSDVYSIGVMMYEALSGDVPFPAETIYECIFRHATEAPPPLAPLRPDLPPAVVALVERCLAKDPGARSGSAAELRADWRRAWGRPSMDAGEPMETAPHRAIPEERAPSRPRRWIALAILAPILAVAAVLAWQRAEISDPATTTSARIDAPVSTEPVVEVEPSRRLEPAVETDPPEEARQVAPAQPALEARTVRIDSTPSRAEVFRGDERLGETPYDHTMEPGADPVVLTLRSRGRQPEVRTIDADTPERVLVELRARPRRDDVPTLAPSY